jgi:hypothetical protein
MRGNISEPQTYRVILASISVDTRYSTTGRNPFPWTLCFIAPEKIPDILLPEQTKDPNGPFVRFCGWAMTKGGVGKDGMNIATYSDAEWEKQNQNEMALAYWEEII